MSHQHWGLFLFRYLQDSGPYFCLRRGTPCTASTSDSSKERGRGPEEPRTPGAHPVCALLAQKQYGLREQLVYELPLLRGRRALLPLKYPVLSSKPESVVTPHGALLASELCTRIVTAQTDQARNRDTGHASNR